MTYHFSEAGCNKSLFVLKFASEGVIGIIDDLHLSFEPDHEVLDLLLFREHILVAWLGLLEKTRIEIVVSLVDLHLSWSLGQLVEDGLDGRQFCSGDIVADIPRS